MNKKLIALAVTAGLAAPMAANAGVTVYGQLQAEIASVDNDTPVQGYLGLSKNSDSIHATKAPHDGIIVDDNKRGRLGVKGDEDLGGGLKAIYMFEFQVETTKADVDDGDREAFVGLKGGFGQLTIGANKSPYKYIGGVKYDPFVATVLEARSNGGMSGQWTDGSRIQERASNLVDFVADENIVSGTGFTVNYYPNNESTTLNQNLNGAKGKFGHHGFITNSLSYKVKAGPATIWATYSPDERGASSGADGDFSAGILFGGKTWEAFVATASDDETKSSRRWNVFADNGFGQIDYIGDYTATKIGGKMTFGGAHTIKAQLETTEFNLTRVDAFFQESYQGGSGKDSSYYNVVGAKLEADVTFVGYEGKFGKNVLVVSWGETDFDQTDEDISYTAVGLIHKFSKTTRAWVGHRNTDFDGGNGDNSATSVGLRIDF